LGKFVNFWDKKSQNINHERHEKIEKERKIIKMIS